MPDDLLVHALCGYASAGGDGRIATVNDTLLAWTGLSREALVGKQNFLDLLTPAGRIFYQGHLLPMLQIGGLVREAALQLVCREGRRLPVLLNVVQRRDAAGDVVETGFTVFNASERWRYEEELLEARRGAEEARLRQIELNRRLVASNAALREQGERLRVTLNAIGDGVVTTDAAGRIGYMNPVALALCGHAGTDLAGRRFEEVVDVRDEESGQRFGVAGQPVEALAALARERKWQLQRSGRQIPVTIFVAPMHNETGHTADLLLVLRDVSAAREYEARLHELATHDTLTGLINRREFERLLALALREDAREGHTLMYLDLDQFKIVNDTCGHAAGDELMRQIAHVMRKALRKGDTLARLGGDEFGILLQPREAGAALAVAERLRHTVRELDFVWNGKLFPIGVSIGAVHLTPGGMSLAEALRQADSACYVAKDKGRNRVHVAVRNDRDVEHHKGEVGWISRLHLALKAERFVLFGQEIRAVHGAPDQPGHVEVLIRLREEDGSLVSPMAFIPAAERYGLMPEIDRWVIATLLRRFHDLPDGAGGTVTYAVNLSGATLCDDSFLRFVHEAFARHEVAPERFCFEVTETAAIANLNQATRLIKELKSMGCRFALDDFGSGMSSFGYLRHLPVDFLKIDGKFIQNLRGDRINQAMVEAINRVGHVMDLETIAEFVEDDATLAILRDIGVDFAQGYGVRKPQPLFPV